MKELNYYGVKELNNKGISNTFGGGDLGYKLGYLLGMLIHQGPTNLERMNKY